MNTGIQSQFGHSGKCLDHDHPGQKGKEETVYADHRRPPDALCGHGFHRPSAGSYGKGEKGQIHTRDAVYPYPDSLPDRMEIPEDLTVKSAMLAVETNLFPLYEIIDGVQYRITHDPKGLPVREYLKIQGRFRHLTEEAITGIQKDVDEQWARLTTLVRGCS